MKRNAKVCVATLAALLSLSANGFAFNEQDAAAKWDAVKGSRNESSFLINLFLEEKMPGEFPHQIRARLREIASVGDAEELLILLVDQEKRKYHTSVYTLLSELKGDEYVELYQKYFHLAQKQETRNKLINLISAQNSPAAFAAAVDLVNSLHTQGLHEEAIVLINYMTRFSNKEIRSDVIDGVSSSSEIVRAASYVALRNYDDEEAEAVVNKALATENAIMQGEERFNAKKRGATFMQRILKTTKKEMQSIKKEHAVETEHATNNEVREVNFAQAAVSADSSDFELAKKYAPQISLSGTGAGGGVDIYDSADYPYIDYIPMDVNSLTSNQDKAIRLYLSSAVNYSGVSYKKGYHNMNDGTLSIIGCKSFNKEKNFLDFSPLSSDSFGTYSSIESGYKSLTLRPTVYFRVFRDIKQKNPIAIQYWFFYFYNDWFKDHPGDWETVTIFLNQNEEPAEVAYSTHYEANRHSWQNISISGANNPKVFVSNGGHGSYAWAGDTPYSVINDNHQGDKEQLSFDANCCDGGVCSDNFSNYRYCLSDLFSLEVENNNWIWFKGRWGDKDSAPQGPHFRTDAPDEYYWGKAKYPPYRSNNCTPRYKEKIYGKGQTGPWNWASGYGLDTPWESKDDCVPIPKVPANVQATKGTYSDKVRVNWKPVATGQKITYQIFRCTSTSKGSCSLEDRFSKEVTSSDKTVIFYDDTATSLGETYYYCVNACNDTGCSNLSAFHVGYLMRIPSAPKGVGASDGTYSGKVRVNWTKVAKATSYQVFRCGSDSTDSCGSGYETSSRPYDDTGVIPGITYYYRVKACNDAGCSGFSNANAGRAKGQAATSLVVDGPAVTGDISPLGDKDMYSFTVPADGVYLLETDLNGTLSDSYMYLYGPNGELLEEDDDSGPGYADKIIRHLASGTYYVTIRAYAESSQSGTYSLSVKKAEINPDPITVNGAVVTGNIWAADEEDWYSFNVSSAGTHTIEMLLGTLADNYIYLYGPNKILLKESTSSETLTRDLSAGVYWIKITSSKLSSETGAYTIRVTR